MSKKFVSSRYLKKFVSLRLLLHITCPYLEFCGPYFPIFRLNTEIHEVSLRVQSKCGKIRTGKTPNTDTFQAVYIAQLLERPAKHCFFFKADQLLQAKAQVWINFFINFGNSDAWQSKYLFLYLGRRQEDVLKNI